MFVIALATACAGFVMGLLFRWPTVAIAAIATFLVAVSGLILAGWSVAGALAWAVALVTILELSYLAGTFRAARATLTRDGAGLGLGHPGPRPEIG